MPVTNKYHLSKIISGGQTGVDRAALDVAIALNIPHGGWCPRGRKAEDGVIDRRYQLQETDNEDYAVRTERNICDADGTLILNTGGLTGGTALTAQLAKTLEKPMLIIDLRDNLDSTQFHKWLDKNNIKILNIAGPRESKCKGIQSKAEKIIRQLLV